MRYQYPDSFVFNRKLNKKFSRAVSSTGSYIIDENGKRYLDAFGGAVVVNIGHSVPEICRRGCHADSRTRVCKRNAIYQRAGGNARRGTCGDSAGYIEIQLFPVERVGGY